MVPRIVAAFEKELLGQLWEGKVNAAIELLKGALEWVRNPTAVEELIKYLENRRAYIPDYQQRQRAGLWIASTRVEKYRLGGVGTMQASGDELVATRGTGVSRHGSHARNGERDAWRRDRALPGASVA